ncbi:adenylate/guanylate cyclase domain-containing protein, partial [Accumulibacter sp.]
MLQAVLFADVTNSTKLYETIGDDEAKRLVDACLEILRDVTAFFGGRVVKTLGDEVMCVFSSADAAAEASCEMQNRLSEDELANKHGLSIRIGFHVGHLIEDHGDVFGDAVNTASRITSLAKGGQTITTETAAAAMSSDLRDLTRSMGRFAVRGKAESIAICEVVWQAENLTMISDRLPMTLPPPTISLRLVYQGGSLTLTPEDEAVVIGRERSCRIRLSVPCASRTHARVEFRRDK